MPSFLTHSTSPCSNQDLNSEKGDEDFIEISIFRANC